MHKPVFFLTFFLFSFNLITAQHPVDDATGKITYSEVIDCELDKDRLYLDARTWITNTFGNYKQVVQLEDKDAGKLIVKGSSTLKEIIDEQQFIYSYTISLDCRDNKYRYILTDIYI